MRSAFPVCSPPARTARVSKRVRVWRFRACWLPQSRKPRTRRRQQRGSARAPQFPRAPAAVRSSAYTVFMVLLDTWYRIVPHCPEPWYRPVPRRGQYRKQSKGATRAGTILVFREYCIRTDRLGKPREVIHLAIPAPDATIGGIAPYSHAPQLPLHWIGIPRPRRRVARTAAYLRG